MTSPTWRADRHFADNSQGSQVMYRPPRYHARELSDDETTHHS